MNRHSKISFALGVVNPSKNFSECFPHNYIRNSTGYGRLLLSLFTIGLQHSFICYTHLSSSGKVVKSDGVSIPKGNHGCRKNKCKALLGYSYNDL